MATTGIQNILLKSGKVKFQIRPYTGKMITTKKGNLIREQGLERYDTFKEAAKRLREVKTQVENNTFTMKKLVPLVSIGCAIYIKNKKEEAAMHGGKRADSTIEFFENITKRHIIPAIGEYKMNQVDRNVGLMARDKWKENLSGQSVNKVLMVARGVFDEQVKSGFIQTNPFKLINNLPRNDDRDKIVEIEPEQVYSHEQDQILLANAHSQRDRLMMRITAEASLRDGEVLGLLEDNIVDGEIQVRQQWSRSKYDESGAPVLSKKLKTMPQSRREIRISDDFLHELKKWKLSNSSNNPHGLMFPNTLGRPCNRKDLWKAINRAVKNANDKGHDLPYRDYYSLRHHFASLMIARGVPIPEVARMMGHKNSHVTLTVYAKFMKSESSFDPNQIFGKASK